MRNFRELEIWKDSIDLATEVYQITRTFPDHEKFGLANQMNRCAISIPSNIAEGCRGSNKELIQFLNISLGSSFELETQLTIARNLSYVDEVSFGDLIEIVNNVQKRINAFRSFILKS